MPEEPLFLTGGDYRLFAVLHRPEAPARGGCVLCAPFAEEKKGAHRILVDLARALCRAGMPVLRFDYRGTGDSEGDFTDFTLAGALADIQQATAFLRSQGGTEIGLLGLRLGATLAAQGDATWLALWEPIESGRRYLQMNLRQQRIRAMMTAAEGEQAKTRLGSAPAVGEKPSFSLPEAGDDFDGYWLTPELQAELNALSFPRPVAGKAPARVLAVSVNAAGRVAPEAERLQTAFTAAGADATSQAVAAEPFWSLQDPAPLPDLVQLTAAWILGKGE